MTGRIVLYAALALPALAILYVMYLVLCAALVSSHREYDHDSRFYRHLLYSSTAWCFFFVRIKVQVSGMEKVPGEGRFLLVGNHRSNFDPIITWYIFKKYPLAFISKKENFKVPVFGRFIRKCCFMAIDRENAKEALKTIMKAAELIKRDEVSVGVYPEGTRNRGGEQELLPFHNGVFKIAQMAKAPVVVVALEGTEKIAGNYPFRCSHVRLKVVETIPASEIADMRTAAIGERVRRDLEEAF